MQCSIVCAGGRPAGGSKTSGNSSQMPCHQRSESKLGLGWFGASCAGSSLIA